MLNGKKLLCVGKYGEDVKKLIEQLGGSAVDRWSKNVSFVIFFPGGTRQQLKKAAEVDVPVVSSSWLVESNKAKKLLDTKSFAPKDAEGKSAKAETLSSKKSSDVDGSANIDDSADADVVFKGGDNFVESQSQQLMKSQNIDAEADDSNKPALVKSPSIAKKVIPAKATKPMQLEIVDEPEEKEEEEEERSPAEEKEPALAAATVEKEVAEEKKEEKGKEKVVKSRINLSKTAVSSSKKAPTPRKASLSKKTEIIDNPLAVVAELKAGSQNLTDDLKEPQEKVAEEKKLVIKKPSEKKAAPKKAVTASAEKEPYVAKDDFKAEPEAEKESEKTVNEKAAKKAMIKGKKVAESKEEEKKVETKAVVVDSTPEKPGAARGKKPGSEELKAKVEEIEQEEKKTPVHNNKRKRSEEPVAEASAKHDEEAEEPAPKKAKKEAAQKGKKQKPENVEEKKPQQDSKVDDEKPKSASKKRKAEDVIPTTPVASKKARTVTPKSNKKKEQNLDATYRIVVTNSDAEALSTLRSVGSTLGDAAILSEVGNNCTHVVTGDQKRSLKVLQALAKGIPLVSLQWVFESITAEKWLDPAKYLVKEFPGASKDNANLFHGKTVYIGPRTKMLRENLADLILSAGGMISPNAGGCNVGVSGERSVLGVKADVPIVKEDWIFDALSDGALPNASAAKYKVDE